MAEKEAVKSAVSKDVVYTPLQVFADTYAKKYGIELMGGFYHTQEKAKKFADTEENWIAAIEAYRKAPVKKGVK